jgi:hypothetical protein
MVPAIDEQADLPANEIVAVEILHRVGPGIALLVVARRAE